MKKPTTITGCDEQGVFCITRPKLSAGDFLIIFLLFLALFSNGQQKGTECIAIKKDGAKCTSYAQTGTQYCYFHNPANKCEGKNKKGEPCGAIKVKGTKFCNHHQPK